jgi:serine/threonine-protein kinase RsbW
MKATFLAKIDHLREMLFWVCDELKNSSLSAKDIYKVEVAMEEALVNIIKHSYKESPGPIEIHLKIFPGHVEILIKDLGPAFNPLEIQPQLDENLPLEERPIGGLGIYLMKQCVDDMKYAREGGANLLSLIKKTAINSQS